MKPGKLLLFVNEDFEDVPSLNYGDVDINIIRTCFKNLGFDVRDTYMNYTTDEVHTVLKNESKTVVNYGCLFIIIITHSESRGKLLSRDGSYTDKEVIEFFTGDKCPDLILIPKYFIFQACELFRAETDENNELDARPFEVNEYTLPEVANIFVIRSSFKLNTLSDKTNILDSYFLLEMCQYMKDYYGSISYFDIITMVLLKIKACRGIPDLNRNHLLPEIMSSLIPAQNTSDFTMKMSLPSEDANFDPYQKFEKLGKLYVFNYNKIPGYKYRFGTLKDRRAIDESFGGLGFEVIIKDDLTTYELMKTLHEAKDFSKDTCVAVVIMTHGDGRMLKTINSEIKEKDLIAMLSNRSKDESELLNKPIIYFIQACRGNKRNRAVKIMQGIRGTTCKALASNEKTTKINASASNDGEEIHIEYNMEYNQNITIDHDDTLIFHSTYEGYVSNRPEEGSWFIQTLCKQINEVIKNKEITTLVDVLYKVQKDVALLDDGSKQMPVIHSTLTKKLWLGQHIVTLNQKGIN